ncbi:unnamed protein product [Brassica oleracea]|uniref:(rape) hypothetical protein n=1 Tax=Brassica napus TaxID=3708 RepID=A0A816S4D3_BRANA|nr:unnamed protein product [Brassica napus]
MVFHVCHAYTDLRERNKVFLLGSRLTHYNQSRHISTFTTRN